VFDVTLERFIQRERPDVIVREFLCWDDAHPFAVYRCFDIYGGLLYVGITRQSLRARLLDHRRRDWWPRVARIELVYGYTEGEARRCELAAIRGEEPLENRAGVTYGWPRKAGLAGWAYQ